MTGDTAGQSVLIRDAAPTTPVTASASKAGGRFVAAGELAADEAEWRDLAADAAERNPFFSPFMLRPALAHLAGGDVRVAVVRDDDGQLIGLAPLAPAIGYARLPVPYLATWMHPHCFFAAPLVRRGAERAFFRGLFEFVDANSARPFLRLRHLDADGPLIAAAEAAARETGRFAHRSGLWERALLRGGYNAKAYLEGTIRKKKRKEMNRLRSRLEEVGATRLRTLEARSEVDEWCAAFLALENAGWKGKEGSALASSKGEATFFRETVRGAFEAGALKFFRLDVAEKPIAMIVNFIVGGEGYSFKIAHDEAFARYSPGVMIEVEMLKALESHDGLKFVDSCATADHPMINSLWTERRRIVGLNVSRKGAASRALLMGLDRLERMRAGIAEKKPPLRDAESEP